MENNNKYFDRERLYMVSAVILAGQKIPADTTDAGLKKYVDLSLKLARELENRIFIQEDGEGVTDATDHTAGGFAERTY